MKANIELVRMEDDNPGDPRFFEQAYEQHFSPVYNYIRYRINDPTVADDLTSVTFHKALDRLATFDPSRAGFGTWIIAIARNAVNDHLRALKRRRVLLAGWLFERPGGEPDPETILIDHEEREVLMAAIATLSPGERDLLGLKFGAGKTNRAIAGMTGKSESNVGVVVHRAIRKLKSRMKAGEDEG